MPTGGPLGDGLSLHLSRKRVQASSLTNLLGGGRLKGSMTPSATIISSQELRVTAIIEGRPVSLLLDTGASFLA
jgi:hypothetical protein